MYTAQHMAMRRHDHDWGFKMTQINVTIYLFGCSSLEEEKCKHSSTTTSLFYESSDLKEKTSNLCDKKQVY